MNESHFIFRPAIKEDCRVIAQLYQVSSDGIADYIWSKIATADEDVLDVGRRRYERENTCFSYQNCTIAEVSGQIVGMLVAFPMHVDRTEVEEDPVLAPYALLEEDHSYYICGVALFPESRGQGVGSKLMALAEQQACKKN